MRVPRVIVLGLAASLAALALISTNGRAASQAAADPPCFGGPAIGPACGTLTEANLHSLVSDLTPAQKVGLVHGQAETADPQFGCGNTGQPNAFPVINPGATGSALVAGCVGQAGINNGVKSLGIPRCARPTAPPACGSATRRRPSPRPS